MAEEKAEQQKDKFPMWIKAAIGVILFAISIWGVAWAASGNSASHDFLVNSHEMRLTSAETDIDDLGEELEETNDRIEATEDMQMTLEYQQQTIIDNLNEVKDEVGEGNKLTMELIKQSVKLTTMMENTEFIEEEP